MLKQGLSPGISMLSIIFSLKLLLSLVSEIWGIIVYHEDSLQMIDFKMKCLEMTTSAKTPMK